MFNFALGYFTPPAFVNIKWKAYLIFGVFSFAMAVHAFFLFPETAGKTLEEVEAMFLDKTPAWKTHVDFKKIRAVEKGEINPEKLVDSFRHYSHASQTEADNAVGRVPDDDDATPKTVVESKV
jgi:hypothetical protein